MKGLINLRVVLCGLPHMPLKSQHSVDHHWMWPWYPYVYNKFHSMQSDDTDSAWRNVEANLAQCPVCWIKERTLMILWSAKKIHFSIYFCKTLHASKFSHRLPWHADIYLLPCSVLFWTKVNRRMVHIHHMCHKEAIEKVGDVRNILSSYQVFGWSTRLKIPTIPRNYRTHPGSFQQ
jgi:hypothetical protein